MICYYESEWAYFFSKSKTVFCKCGLLPLTERHIYVRHIQMQTLCLSAIMNLSNCPNGSSKWSHHWPYTGKREHFINVGCNKLIKRAQNVRVVDPKDKEGLEEYIKSLHYWWACCNWCCVQAYKDLLGVSLWAKSHNQWLPEPLCLDVLDCGFDVCSLLKIQK